MGIFSEEVKTSVSMYIEKLTNLEEIDWYLFQQLIESMMMQDSGPREAVETIRKKLKHGGTQQKLRALEVLKLLMENSNQNFHRQMIANEKMLERFELILNSPSEDIHVKKELLSLLGTWSEKYKNEPGMRSISHLYDSGRGRRHHTRPVGEAVVRSPDNESSNRSPSPPRARRNSVPYQRPAEEQQQQQVTNRSNRSHSSAASRPNNYRTTITTPTTTTTTTDARERVFNFEKAKPKIIEEIALANQLSNNLINALKLINTKQDRWETELHRDKRVQEYRDKCEESKKKIVRYARLVENEEWIGTLLAANEDLLKALDMYDIMSVGEIPASWNILHEAHSEPASLSYNAPLQIEDSMSHLQIEPRRQEPEELEDPFADPFADPLTDEEEYYERRR